MISAKSVYVKGIIGPRQGTAHRICHTSAPHYVDHTMNFNKRPQSKPRTDIQNSPVIQFILCNSVVALLACRALPQTHTAYLFIYLIHCGCASQVRVETYSFLLTSVIDFRQNGSSTTGNQNTDPFSLLLAINTK